MDQFSLISRRFPPTNLDLRGGDVEPFGDSRVNRSWWLPRVERQAYIRGVIRPDVSRGVLESHVADRKLVGRCLGGAFTICEATPRFVALVNDFCGVFLVLGLARESELILGLAVRNFVDTEPLVRGADEAR